MNDLILDFYQEYDTDVLDLFQDYCVQEVNECSQGQDLDYSIAININN